MLRPETRTRARALQLLYAWDVRGRPPLEEVVGDTVRGRPHWRAAVERAGQLAEAVVADVGRLDRRIADAVDHWRPQRVGVIEQNILRLCLHELELGVVPPKVAITEAVQLAHWFAGARAPAFVNGVLDALARQAGCL